MNILANASYAGGEWAWIAIACGFVIFMLCFSFWASKKDNDSTYLLLGSLMCLVVGLGTLLLVPEAAKNRGNTVDAKNNLAEAGFDFTNLSVSGNRVTLRGDNCNIDATLIQRSGRYFAVIERNDGTNIVLTPEQIDQWCQ